MDFVRVVMTYTEFASIKTPHTSLVHRATSLVDQAKSIILELNREDRSSLPERQYGGVLQD